MRQPAAISASRAASLWAGALVLSATAAAAVWIRLGLPSPGCRFREWTGLPCATCGTMRMLRELSAGDVAAAIRFNPMMFAVLAALVGWTVRALVLVLAGRPPSPVELGPRARRVLVLAAAIAFAAGWAYQIWRL